MITRGHVQDGVVVLADGVRLPEGQEVAVLSSPPAEMRQSNETVVVSKERQEALRQLIGIWKSEHPPDDEEVERIIEQERMKKYG